MIFKKIDLSILLNDYRIYSNLKSGNELHNKKVKSQRINLIIYLQKVGSIFKRYNR
ncbi:MAG: hypothetical protein KBG82_03965 [Spirochaetes bacterium]|nr:hypothetical protein [Spirochaetota bacterium]